MNIFESYGFVFGKVTQLMSEAFEEALIPYQLSSREYGILVVIEEHSGISQKQIGIDMQVDRTTMVAIIDKLEKQGCCTRHINPEDRRSYALALTEQGEKLVQIIWPVLEKIEIRVLSSLPKNIKKALLQIPNIMKEGK